MLSSSFIRLFVCRLKQKLLKGFSQNSVERWHMGPPWKKPFDFGE